MLYASELASGACPFHISFDYETVTLWTTKPDKRAGHVATIALGGLLV